MSFIDKIRKSIEDSKIGLASRTTKQTWEQNKAIVIADIMVI